MTNNISFADFQRLDIRVGTIINAEEAHGLKSPAYRLSIDFGELGNKQSCAQLTDHYTAADLVGRQVLAVVNFKPKQIGPHISEVLVLGACEETGAVVLLAGDKPVHNGARLR